MWIVNHVEVWYKTVETVYPSLFKLATQLCVNNTAKSDVYTETDPDTLIVGEFGITAGAPSGLLRSQLLPQLRYRSDLT